LINPANNDNAGEDTAKPEVPPAGDGTLTPEQAAKRYDAGLDAGAWDYDAAAAGTDEVTEAYRKLIVEKYRRAEKDSKEK
jgi:hypothetical protein